MRNTVSQGNDEATKNTLVPAAPCAANKAVLCSCSGLWLKLSQATLWNLKIVSLFSSFPCGVYSSYLLNFNLQRKPFMKCPQPLITAKFILRFSLFISDRLKGINCFAISFVAKLWCVFDSNKMRSKSFCWNQHQKIVLVILVWWLHHCTRSFFNLLYIWDLSWN